MDTLLQDIRYSTRKLMRSPGFTAVTLATIALAIGATTAVFSIVNGVLLRPLPFRDPQGIVLIASTAGTGKVNPMSGPDFIDYRSQSRSFAATALYTTASMNFTGTAVPPVRLSVASVGARFFDVLGVRPQLGRSFTAGEDEPSAQRVMVLSDGLWRSRFGADPRILGQSISLDGNAYQIIGVAEPRLTFPARAEAWVPFVPPDWFVDPQNRGAHSMYAIGRLTHGVSVKQATNELAAIARRLEVAYPRSNTGFGAKAELLQQHIVGDVGKALYTMLGAVGFVLLIACANVANLLLVRAATRESEIAVRTALGAGRGRLVRQLVTESVLLAMIGAVVGTAMAAWAVDAVVAYGPAGLPRLAEITMDTRVLLFSAGTALLTGLLFGLVPALHAARPDIAQMLRESVRGTSRGGARRTRAILVVTELALAVVLLLGAGLLVRSFSHLIDTDPGFSTENVVSFSLTLPVTKYPYDRDVRRFAEQVRGQLASVPGTQQVAVTFARPLQTMHMRTGFDIAGRPAFEPGKRPVAEVHPASPSFFATMGMPLVRGRSFTEAENVLAGPGTVVVSEEFVRRYFPNEDPLGKRILFGVNHDTAAVGQGTVDLEGEIIGIVRDIKQQGLAGENYPLAYVPFNKLPIQDMAVLVRTSADARLVQSAIRARVREIDADLPIYELMTMDQAISESVSQPRFYMLLLAAFAGVALLLAAIGIYGVISYAVSLRTSELGIRIALGASRERVVRLVLGQGIWLTVAGVVVGLVAAFWLTRALSSLLFGVGAMDPVTFAVVPAGLVAIAVAASYLPARRAARVDPVIAMRAE